VRAEKKFGQTTQVKIVYFTQLLGLALGLKPRQVGLQENISDSMQFFKDKGIA
jgi:heterodisulfide reductase subunit B